MITICLDMFPRFMYFYQLSSMVPENGSGYGSGIWSTVLDSRASPSSPAPPGYRWMVPENDSGTVVDGIGFSGFRPRFRLRRVIGGWFRRMTRGLLSTALDSRASPSSPAPPGYRWMVPGNGSGIWSTALGSRASPSPSGYRWMVPGVWSTALDSRASALGDHSTRISHCFFVLSCVAPNLARKSSYSFSFGSSLMMII